MTADARLRRAQIRLVAGAVLVVLAAAGPVSAMTLLPLDLAALTSQAGRIFVGRVEHVEAGRDANGLPVTWTTFAVEETLKGIAADHVTLKQLGARLAGTDGRVLPHPGLPRYQTGESVVLFVHPESALGLTSPVGLGQGCFRIRDRDGGAVVENDVANRNLGLRADARANLATMAMTDAPAPLALGALLERVRALIAAPR